MSSRTAAVRKRTSAPAKRKLSVKAPPKDQDQEEMDEQQEEQDHDNLEEEEKKRVDEEEEAEAEEQESVKSFLAGRAKPLATAAAAAAAGKSAASKQQQRVSNEDLAAAAAEHGGSQFDEDLLEMEAELRKAKQANKASSSSSSSSSSAAAATAAAATQASKRQKLLKIQEEEDEAAAERAREVEDLERSEAANGDDGEDVADVMVTAKNPNAKYSWQKNLEPRDAITGSVARRSEARGYEQPRTSAERNALMPPLKPTHSSSSSSSAAAATTTKLVLKTAKAKPPSPPSTPPTPPRNHVAPSIPPRVKKPLPPFTAMETSLRHLFPRDGGYRIHPEDLNVKHISLRMSVSSPDKIAAMKEKSQGRNNSVMKTRFVNVVPLFQSMPAGATNHFSKFIEDLDKKVCEPYRLIQLTPVMKIAFPHLVGLGSADKTVNASKPEDAQHEFSLSDRAHNEHFLDDQGRHAAGGMWMDKTKELWRHLSVLIAMDRKIAPELKEKCEEDMKSGRVATDGKSHAEVYKNHYLNTFIQSKENDTTISFGTKMLRYATKEEREYYRASEKYVAPSDRLQAMYDDAGKFKEQVYCDLPVVRPKTKAEAEATWKQGDTNPFIYVPFAERVDIVSGSLASCLYEVSVTENHQGKSYLKLKPMLLIWIRDVAVARKAVPLTKPFVFPEVEATVEDGPAPAEAEVEETKPAEKGDATTADSASTTAEKLDTSSEGETAAAAEAEEAKTEEIVEQALN